ncbi:hypothetical protein R3P38DRAFT_3391393 [Favolaschia claudopus]|uniref:Uncharacterized protein n=1 Tax=Favolaschia claudopus TaxID=2862362 RepID=A0AAW0CJ47_9AGAR
MSDAQALPVINSVTPALPHVAQVASAPAPEDQTPPISSTNRSMAGQTSASFSAMLNRQASASTDSLINSLVDPAPASPAAKTNASAAIAGNTTAGSSAPLKPAPAGKAEAAASGTLHTMLMAEAVPDSRHDLGIRRLDSNMAAVASRLEDHISKHGESLARVDGDLTSLRDQVKNVVSDKGTSLPSFTAQDMLLHPTIKALIASNNQSVNTIESLRAEVAALHAAMHDTDRKRKRDDDTVMYSEDVFLPAVKRVRDNHEIRETANTVVAASAGIPAAPQPLSYIDLTGAGPSNVGTAPEAPPPVPANNASGVDIGPIGWGKDISGQVRALIARMKRGHAIDADAVKNLYAKRFPKNNKFVTAFFPTNVAAIQFVNAWEAAPPAGYEKTSVSFSGN